MARREIIDMKLARSSGIHQRSVIPKVDRRWLSVFDVDAFAHGRRSFCSGATPGSSVVDGRAFRAEDGLSGQWCLAS